jgi:TatD DNase family protein
MLENNLPVIDSHFHLAALARKGIESGSLLEQMERSGMAGGIDIGVDCDDLAARAPLVAKFPSIRQSAGIGPWGVDEGCLPIDRQLDTLARMLDAHPVCAIGEIGLDNHWKFGTPELQEKLFLEQVAMANERKLPVIIHCREADEQMVRVFSSQPFRYGGILHCFQGTRELADIAVAQGFYISFAGPLTYKRNEEMRSILAALPLDRILLETDSPYLSPEPYRGQVNTPPMVRYVYERASEVRAMSVETLAMQIRENFEAFLRRDNRS